MDTRGVKTELVERLKAALEGESGEKETELEVDKEASLEGESGEKEAEIAMDEEAVEVEADKPESPPANKVVGGEYSKIGKPDESKDVATDEIQSNTEVAGAILEEDVTDKESDPNLEEL